MRPAGARTGTKALIKVGYACNEHCGFCHTLEVRHIQGSTAEIDNKIRRAAELGHEMVVLSGGEPTIRPEDCRARAERFSKVRFRRDFAAELGRLLPSPGLA